MRTPPTPPSLTSAPAALAAGVALLLLLACAPPESNLFWAVNGLRSSPLELALLVVLSAIAAGAWAAGLRVPGRWVAGAGALAIAWPLHENAHFLGDTFVRWRQLDFTRAGGPIPSFALLARQMHAQPLDNLLGLWGPLHLVRFGMPPAVVLSAAGFALALLFFRAASGIARTIALEDGAESLAAVMATAGSLQVFAGYAESGGVVLAFGALWWFALLRPLRGRGDVAFAALAWLALALAHRIALVALAPQLARALFIRLEGDEAGARRELFVATLGVSAVAVLGVAPVAGGALGRDLVELAGTLGHVMPAADLANLLLLVTPLALLAPALAGADALRSAARSPVGALHAVAFVALSPLVFLFPMAAHGLGAHRDWELAVLPGFVATSFAAHALARLDLARRRTAVVIALPVLLLIAGGWLLVNADGAAAERRAEALGAGAHGPAVEQRSQVLVYLGYRASDRGDDAASARWFDAAYAALPNPRNALLAAESWMRAGDWEGARQSLLRVRSHGALPDELERVARLLESRFPPSGGDPRP